MKLIVTTTALFTLGLPEGRHASQVAHIGDTLWIGLGANARDGAETETILEFTICPDDNAPNPSTPPSP